MNWRDLCPQNDINTFVGVKTLYPNKIELYDAIYKINLQEFLGIDRQDNFDCIFHYGSKGTGFIFKEKKDGRYLYRCRDPECGFVGNIIRIIERLQSCNRVEALNFVCKVYDLGLEETEYQIHQKQILEENKNMLFNNEIEQQYPELWKKIKRYTPYLYILNDIAKNYIPKEPIYNDENLIPFFTSFRYIANKLKKHDHKRTGNAINFLTFLGLIEKLNIEELDNELFRKISWYKNKKKYSSYFNVYNIPSYCDKVLTNSEKKATQWNQNHFTMSGFSREMILRALGDKEANRVFPQSRGKKIANTHKNLTSQIEKISLSLIDKQGYVTEKQIVSNIKCKKYDTKKQLKIIMGEFLDKYNLRRIRLNKKLKQELNIDCPGYPFVITRDR